MSYQTIKAALNAYLHRSDLETVGNEDRAMESARIKLSRSFFPRQSWLVVSLVPVAGRAALPLDFGLADLVTTATGELSYIDPRSFVGAEASTDPHAVAGLYSIIGQDLAVDVFASPVTLGYFAAAPAISGGSENWLSLYFPDVWLMMAQAEQQRFIQDYDGAALTEQYARELAVAAQTDSTRGAQSGGRINMRGR